MRLILGLIALGNLCNVMPFLLSAAVFQAQIYSLFTYDSVMLFQILMSQKKTFI